MEQSDQGIYIAKSSRLIMPLTLDRQEGMGHIVFWWKSCRRRIRRQRERDLFGTLYLLNQWWILTRLAASELRVRFRANKTS